jgi:hypothetical protein
MLFPTRSRLVLTLLAVALFLLACDCGSITQLVVPAPTAPPPTVTRHAAPIAATPAQIAPTPTAAILTLKLPTGQSVAVPVYKCDGIGANQYLDLIAATTQDLNDANRVQVKIGGAHAGVGKLDKMFVEVTLGAQNKWTFVGNTPNAQITLEANGTGRFADVAIVNAAATSANYQASKEYKFSAEWLCK